MVTDLLRVIIMVRKDFDDFTFLANKLDSLTLLCKEVVCLSPSYLLPRTHLGERWAMKNWWAIEQYATYHDKKNTPKIWKKRNKQMVRTANAVVVFWDMGDKEIADLLKRAEKRKLPIREYLV